MKVLLLANQPEKTTRLRLFEATLKELGYETIVPRFDTVNWISIARKARGIVLKERPDIVHLFNVPAVRLPAERFNIFCFSPEIPPRERPASNDPELLIREIPRDS